MKHLDRLNITGNILEEYLPLLSQWDQNVIENNNKKVTHPWIDQLMKLSDEELYLFDGQRQSLLLNDSSWLNLIEKIKQVSLLDQVNDPTYPKQVLGNKKKQHELNRLYSILHSSKPQNIKAVDFGGGVGNLAHFLENNLNMNPIVLEQDMALIEKGRTKLKKYNSKVDFHHCKVCANESISILNQTDFAIGLHTCGNFAKHMIDKCVESKVKEFVNFGCCYSKIENEQYHLCQSSHSKLVFNQRALSAATLSFGTVSKEIYQFRRKIMNYKFSFYNWLYREHGIIKFCPMSNSRRAMYDQSFYDFVSISLKKYFPEIEIPNEKGLIEFFNSEKNIKLNRYLNSYYAIARYLGEALEIYILSDRALFIEEHGYSTNIVNVFDHSISPRNKGIFAFLNT